MSSVTILASAAQDDAGTGAAVDVSAFSTLRLNWQVDTDHGRHPHIALAIDSAPTADGPWTEVSRLSMDGSPQRWVHRPRVVLAGFDSFVRARWKGRIDRLANDTAKAFTIGLVGDGKPDTE